MGLQNLHRLEVIKVPLSLRVATAGLFYPVLFPSPPLGRFWPFKYYSLTLDIFSMNMLGVVRPDQLKHWFVYL